MCVCYITSLLRNARIITISIPPRPQPVEPWNMVQAPNILFHERACWALSVRRARVRLHLHRAHTTLTYAYTYMLWRAKTTRKRTQNHASTRRSVQTHTHTRLNSALLDINVRDIYSDYVSERSCMAKRCCSLRVLVSRTLFQHPICIRIRRVHQTNSHTRRELRACYVAGMFMLVVELVVKRGERERRYLQMLCKRTKTFHAELCTACKLIHHTAAFMRMLRFVCWVHNLLHKGARARVHIVRVYCKATTAVAVAGDSNRSNSIRHIHICAGICAHESIYGRFECRTRSHEPRGYGEAHATHRIGVRD